eukprot:COSAG06_NODE_1643_length_8827_cov_1.799496_3_plen_75_part_00
MRCALCTIRAGSYALAMSRRWCVERGTLFDTPTFEWLDAYETKATTFRLSIQALEAGEETPTGTALTGLLGSRA